MATSGTTAFNLDLTEIVEEAFERCGAEMRTGYDLRTARRSLNLLFADWANQGLNMWTFDQGTIPMVEGQATYTLPADTVDLMEHTLRTGSGPTQVDITMSRISVSTYATLTNKTAQGRPIQVFVERLTAPQVTVWPVPDQTGVYTLVYWRLRRIEDAGTGANTVDMPVRFLPAMIAGLAYYMAMKVPGALERLPVLKEQYDAAWRAASEEDREKAPVRIMPRIASI